jgi:hypothetical protein
MFKNLNCVPLQPFSFEFVCNHHRLFAYLFLHVSPICGQTLNMKNKLNVALVLTQLQNNAQPPK